MTVIVAAQTTDGVTVAADIQTTDGQSKMHGVESKIHDVGSYVVAVSGSKRIGQVIKHTTVWPTPPEGPPGTTLDVLAFLIRSVVPAIQAACRVAGVLREENGVTSFDAVILLVAAGLIAEIDGDGCVHIDRSGRWAVGSGAQPALGYLGDTGPWTTEQVVEAAHRAIRLDLGCGGGVDVVALQFPQVVEEQPSS